MVPFFSNNFFVNYTFMCNDLYITLINYMRQLYYKQASYTGVFNKGRNRLTSFKFKRYMTTEASLVELENPAGNRVYVHFFKWCMMIERRIGMLGTPLVTGFLFSFSKNYLMIERTINMLVSVFIPIKTQNTFRQSTSNITQFLYT